MKDANDGLDEIIDPAIDQAEGFKRNEGRYTLEEAATFISERTGQDAKGLRDKLIVAVGNDELSMYAQFSHIKMDTQESFNTLGEFYWNDLNEWLEKNEPRLDFKFPQPLAETNDAMARKHGEQTDAPAPQKEAPASASNALHGFGPRQATTNAPPPIKPMGQSNTGYKGPSKTPDWREWGHMPTVTAWQACALSLNINPHLLEKHEAWGSSTSLSFTLRKEVSDEYNLRKRVLIANLPEPDDYPKDTPITPSYFVDRAKSFGWSMPSKLEEMARKPTDAPEQIDAPASAGNADAKKGGAGGTLTTKVAKPKQETGEPFLQVHSRNSRAEVEKWVAWQARTEVKDGDNTADLAGRILKIADNFGYESERGEMTLPSITKMLPAGLTGGRRKNKGVKAKK